jgi:CBS domain-containing protein
MREIGPGIDHGAMAISDVTQDLALRSVSSAMHHGVITCHPSSTLRDVARTMANGGIHLVVVWGDEEDDSEGVWGVVSDVDLVAAAARGDALASSALSASHSTVVTIAANESLLHAAHLMVERGVTHLLVLSPDLRRPVGVLSTLDLAQALARAA